MKKSTITLLSICLLAFMGLGCETSTDTTDSGGVILSIADFDGWPQSVSVNSNTFVQIETLTIRNIVKDPTGTTSDLMGVELRSFEISFTRADTGSRIPVTRVTGLFGFVEPNGEFMWNNPAILGPSELGNAPLSDLLGVNGGVDSETGFNSITLNVHMRVFGRTLSGDPVESSPATRTIVFTP